MNRTDILLSKHRKDTEEYAKAMEEAKIYEIEKQEPATNLTEPEIQETKTYLTDEQYQEKIKHIYKMKKQSLILTNKLEKRARKLVEENKQFLPEEMQ